MIGTKLFRFSECVLQAMSSFDMLSSSSAYSARGGELPACSHQIEIKKKCA